MQTDPTWKILYSFALGACLATFGSCSTGPTPISRELNQKPMLLDSVTDEDSNAASVNHLLGTTTSSQSGIRFDWPVEDARLTRGFLPHKRRPHWGVDLAANRGTTILAAQSGMVLYTGRDFRGFGKMVLLESGNGWATLYAHLDKILVSEGQILTNKDVIGLMGRTGRATGVHLHFEIRKDKGPVNPLDYLPGGPTIARRN